MKVRRFFLFLISVLVFSLPEVDAENVRMWDEDLVIPTWRIGPAEVNPTFVWSSARQEVYPYPYKEILTDEKIDKTYRACWLENEFIKVLILPEIGGRLHGAQDKTSSYNFFYWQPTIKPALVGMTGAWISGGIEWNFPHGHRPTGFSRVQYRLVENSDGSKTVWVGEPELVHRMRWIVGLTVYPGRSYVEAKVRLMNPGPLRHSFQMWTTTAVNANENYQAVFPTRLMTGHGKFEYFHWPIHEGSDISWWKNVPNAASFFAEERGEFFGGYDHARNAGTVITGNPDIVIGKKFWTWGTSPSGRLWEPILTEGQGPYLEPQAGAYSDNQPDYHWIQPGEIKSYSHFFFPVRDIGQFKMANTEGALNLDFVGDRVKIGVYSTSILNSASITLEAGGSVLYTKVLDLDPSRPFVQEIPIDQASERSQSLRLNLRDADGTELIAYSPEILEPLELPEPRQPYGPPEEIQTLDELWHAGDWTYKFRNPKGGRAYFEEAIRRDPGDTRSRIELAEMDIKRARYQSALEHLRIAALRDPDNGRNFYLKGLALEAEGHDESAYRAYYRSVHFDNYLARAYARIAALDLKKGSAERAVQHVELAIQKNKLDPSLWALKATALRQTKEFQSAFEAAEQALELDPLDLWASNEHWKAGVTLGHREGSRKESFENLAFNSQVTIESALRYSNAGLYEDALDLLEEMAGEDALALYYRGFFLDRLDRKQEAARLFEKGRKVTVDGTFAFRREALDVFQTALKVNPDDGTAHYYMGLVFAKVADVERAIQHWERSVQLDPQNPRCWRNLGLALAQSDEHLERSLDCYEKAFALDSEDSRSLLEMDQVKTKLGVSSADRLAFLRAHRETAEKRDAIMHRMVDLLIEAGDYQEALDYLKNRHFHSWEGNYSIHNAYMETNIALAERAGNPQEALHYYQEACKYPGNLEVAPREPNLRGFLYHPMAQLHRKLGQEAEARRLLEITAKETSPYPTLAAYYRAMALQDLGREEEAQRVLGELETEARALIAGNSEHYSRQGATMQVALGHCYLAYVRKARGERGEASKSLEGARSEVPGIGRQAIQIAQRAFARAHQ